MHGTHTRSSSIIVDSVTVISVITGSNTLLTFAIALHGVATGMVWVPPGPENREMACNVVQFVSDPQWRYGAQRALEDPQVENLARLFFDACISSVPTKAENPISDETWILGVRSFVAQEQSMQLAAAVLLSQLRLLDKKEIAESGGISATNSQPVTTAPVAALPARVATRHRNRSCRRRVLRKQRRK